MPLSSGPATPRLRPWMIVAPVGVLLAAGVGLVALHRLPLPSAAPIGGDAVQISVIPPVEPEVSPGERMEVGDLVEGYDPALVPVAEPDADAADDGYQAAYASAWLEPVEEPAPVAYRRFEAPVVSPTAPQPEATPAGNPYGFDAPGPDYDAARQARRERLDRLQAEASARPPLDTDTAFY